MTSFISWTCSLSAPNSYSYHVIAVSAHSLAAKALGRVVNTYHQDRIAE